MTYKLDELLGFHQTALNLRAYRQQMIASNIANADTPNYKAKDIDFRAALQGALSKRPAPDQLATTSAQHMKPGGAAADLPIKYRSADQPSVDGNTVNMDVERGEFINNAIHYEANVEFIRGQFRTMLAAIQG
jgi:flagellar basal-body rod protein FlgB